VGWTAFALVNQNIYFFKYVDWLILDIVHPLDSLYPSDLPFIESILRVLQAFRKDSTVLFMATSAKCQNRKAEAQLIGLVRRVFIFADGLEDVH
jgi:hypothetical protein